MIRILVFGMTENPGGIETFIMNYYRNIDRNQIQFDFLCNTYEQVAYEDELVSMGGHVFHFSSRRRNPIKFYKELNSFFAKHANEYAAIWVNTCSLANIDYLKLARRYGVDRRIIHSHNSQNMEGIIRRVLHEYNKRVIHQYATDFWACSKVAAEWFYPSHVIGKVIIVHNAIDVEHVAFNSEERALVRKEFDVNDDCVLIGNVGRLHFQKNQSFAIDVFKEYLDLEPNAKLVFVGQGEDEQMLKNKVEKYNLVDKVIFTGVRYDVRALLSAFDVYLFPSVFEGLGIAALEAEANGMPVIASADVIPEDVHINDNFCFFSLENSAKEWANKLLEMHKTYDRISYNEVLQRFMKKNYEIKNEAAKLQSLLLEKENA